MLIAVPVCVCLYVCMQVHTAVFPSPVGIILFTYRITGFILGVISVSQTNNLCLSTNPCFQHFLLKLIVFFVIFSPDFL